MKWPVKNKPGYGDKRETWKFAWFPKKVKLFDSTRTREQMYVYWVWLENYHVIQYYSNHGFWYDMYDWTYPINYTPVLEV